MKVFLVVIAFCVVSFLATGQVVKFRIEGTVLDTVSHKFAYLTTLSQQRTISSDKLFVMAPIKNGRFNFEGEFELNGEFYQNACLFFDKRANISKKEVASKFYNLIWVVGRDENLKQIILEDMNIKLSAGNIRDSMELLREGKFTKQLKILSEMKKTPKGLESFIAMFPDSPVSFYSLEGIYEAYIDRNFERLLRDVGEPYAMFNLLSERLKRSEKGKRLKENMDSFFKK